MFRLSPRPSDRLPRRLEPFTMDQRPTASDRKRKQWEVMVLNSIMIIFCNTAIWMSRPPQNSIFEEIICDKELGDRRINTGDDDGCRGTAVQSELAFINGWKNTFDALPSILLAMAYGALADRIGRKPCLQLCVLGFLLSETWTRIVCLWPNILPLRLVWLSGLWRCIGGGENVMDCIIIVMVMDVFEERDRLIALPRVYAVFVTARLIAAPASAALMSLGTPWLPFLLSLGMITVAQILSFFIPETLGYAEDAKPVEEDTLESSKPTSAKKQSLGLSESAKFILNNRNMMPIIVANLVSSIAKYAHILMLQYSATRYNWSYSLSSLAITIREASSLVNFLVLIPLATAYLRRGIRGSVVAQDKFLCQGMGFFNLIGFSAVGLAGTPVIYMMALVLVALGTGFDTAMSSFVTSLVQPDQIASLHSVIAMAKSIGGILAGPIFAYLMQLGLRLDGAWLGIPYYAAGLSFLMVMAAVASIRIKPRALDEAEEPLLEV